MTTWKRLLFKLQKVTSWPSGVVLVCWTLCWTLKRSKILHVKPCRLPGRCQTRDISGGVAEIEEFELSEHGAGAMHAFLVADQGSPFGRNDQLA